MIMEQSDREKLVAIRMPGSLWAAAQAKAKAEGTTVSALVRAWLRRYLDATP